MPKNKNKKQRKEFTPPERFTDGNLRHPRPMGLTMLNLNTLKNQNLKENLTQRIVNLYVNEGMQWMGKQTSVAEMALYLNIRPERMLTLMNKDIERLMGFFEGKEGMALARVQLNLALKKGLEILALHHNQVHLLLGQQGNEYVPFLSAEVNKALGNYSSAMKPYLDAIKLMTDKMSTSPYSPSTGDSSNGGTKYLSASEAIAILNQGSDSMYTNKALVDEKMQTMLGLPDVNARNQNLTEIGIRQTGSSTGNMHGKTNQKTQIIPERGKDDVADTEDFVA